MFYQNYLEMFRFRLDDLGFLFAHIMLGKEINSFKNSLKIV